MISYDMIRDVYFYNPTNPTSQVLDST